MNILHLKLDTENLNATVDFYHHTMGLPILNQTSTACSFQAGNTQLSFVENKRQKAYYHFAFTIATNHLEPAIRWANENQIELLKSPKDELITRFESWNSASVYFWDNNGNLLEFIARADLNIQKDTPFTPEEMLCVSEIGLVTQDPIATAKAIRLETGVDFFSKSKPLPEFCALGDDQGLIILVSPTRNWYPTSRLAIPCPAEVQIESNKKTHQIYSNHWK